jgi:hypothetical protein
MSVFPLLCLVVPVICVWECRGFGWKAKHYLNILCDDVPVGRMLAVLLAQKPSEAEGNDLPGNHHGFGYDGMTLFSAYSEAKE